ncbi:hypothetical protein N7488_001104 [Penicillium malachiteum]|nr:hypothetical protein N7488_001104 [Penicillium malachiteum]
MPLRPVVVRSPQNNRGSNEEAYVYNNFNNLTLADRHAPGRSYAPGEHSSSSGPSYDRNGGWHALLLHHTMALILGRKAPFKSKSGISAAQQQFGSHIIPSQ